MMNRTDVAARRMTRKSDNHHDLIIDRDPGFLEWDHVQTIRASRLVQRGPNVPILVTRNESVDKRPAGMSPVDLDKWIESLDF